MAKALIYNQKGDQTGEVELSPALFEVEMNQSLLQQVVVAQQANSRLTLADTKTKGEVSGGGKKPWKQKGTGRARHGSIRSPLWKGGGVTFGPTTAVNYSKKVNKKVKRQALAMVLSEKAAEARVLIIDSLVYDKPATKSAASLMKKMKLDNRLLLVLEKIEEQTMKSFRNIDGVNVIAANSLNVYDIMKSKNVIFTSEALKESEKIYSKK